jgi:hypothetical protein
VKTASGLTLLAIGAVLAFAVHGHPWFLNLQVCGWIIIVIGIFGMAVPRSGYGWLRRQVVVRRGPDGQPRMGVRSKRYPPYIMINPAAVAANAEEAEVAMPEMPTNSMTKSWETTERVVPDEETVEEYFEE